MPILNVGVCVTSLDDGYAQDSNSSMNRTGSTISAGAVSSTIWSRRIFSLYQQVKVPRNAFIIDTRIKMNPSTDKLGAKPVMKLTFQDAISPVAPTGYADMNGRSYFTGTIWQPSSWLQGQIQRTPNLSDWFQALVSRSDWPDDINTTVLYHGDLESRSYPGVVDVIQYVSADASSGIMHELEITYSLRKAIRMSHLDFGTGLTNTAGGAYRGHRFRTGKAITVSGVLGGSGTLPSWVALYADNNGVIGSVLRQKLIDSPYGVHRFEPIVLEPNTWYWYFQGMEVSSGATVARLSSWNREAMIAEHGEGVSEILPATDGSYLSSLRGLPSVLVGTNPGTTAVPIASGLEYIVGDANIDDITPPTLSVDAISGF